MEVDFKHNNQRTKIEATTIQRQALNKDALHHLVNVKWHLLKETFIKKKNVNIVAWWVKLQRYVGGCQNNLNLNTSHKL